MLEFNTVGYAGWVLPEVAIIDHHGLNDAVVAHTPVERAWSGERLMAHERIPPPGYVDCFKPNVILSPRRAVIDRNVRRLTDEIIVECETKFRRARQ